MHQKKAKYKQVENYTNHFKNQQQSIKQKKLKFKTLIIYVYLPVVILLNIIFFTSLLTNTPVDIFSRDPAAILAEQKIVSFLGFKTNPFIGVISNLGLLLWCASASVYLFAFLLKTANNKQKQKQKQSDSSLFLLLMGLFSLVLLFDDMLLFHEVIAPKLFIPEKAIYICYMAITIYLMLKFRKILFTTETIPLYLAFLFFFLSIIIDIFNFSSIFLEDGFKLLGIASWASYSVIVALQLSQDYIVRPWDAYTNTK